MEIITYSFIAAGIVGGLIFGWFIRHKVLNRHLMLSRTKLEEMRALQMNVEHELSTLRQKLIKHSGNQEKLTSQTENTITNNVNTEKTLKKLDALQHSYEQVSEDNEVLQEQINYFEAEKSSNQRFRKQVQAKIDHVSKENKQLRSMISNLKKEKSKAIQYKHSPGKMPQVQRVDPKEWQKLQKQQAEKTNDTFEKDQTSKIDAKQSKSTDRVKTRESVQIQKPTMNDPKPPAAEYFEPEIDVEPSPQQELFPEPEPEENDAAFLQTVSDEQPIVEIIQKPEPPKPKPIPTRESVASFSKNQHKKADPFSELNPEKLTRKRRCKPKKKKPSTVRIDTSSSDIINSFKKELGLPGK
ncbi:hypothetical protein K8T06_15245 [bacterium]|nr:hypothetical protein [bacterium]